MAAGRLVAGATGNTVDDLARPSAWPARDIGRRKVRPDHAPFLIGHVGLVSARLANMLLAGAWRSARRRSRAHLGHGDRCGRRGGRAIHLRNEASKARVGPAGSSRCAELRRALIEWQQGARRSSPHVITTERTTKTSAHAVVLMFAKWYRALGLNGCSSHSGRRTFITNAARKISTVGGSLRDV